MLEKTNTLIGIEWRFVLIIMAELWSWKNNFFPNFEIDFTTLYLQINSIKYINIIGIDFSYS